LRGGGTEEGHGDGVGGPNSSADGILNSGELLLHLLQIWPNDSSELLLRLLID